MNNNTDLKPSKMRWLSSSKIIGWISARLNPIRPVYSEDEKRTDILTKEFEDN